MDMDDAPMFRIAAVLPFALQLANGDEPPLTTRDTAGRPATDRARAALGRVKRRGRDGDLVEAMSALVDIVAGLEREIERLRRVQLLTDIGVELQPELVSLSGDGVGLQRSAQWLPGAELWAYVNISLRHTDYLLCLRSRLIESTPGSAELQFIDIDREQRDLLVAFAFQQQGKERRRALDASTGDS